MPWTRLIREGKREGPNGRIVDLPEYIRRHRTRLVLKPNRLCGGDGVTIGVNVTPSVWERTLDRALREAGGWVVQSHIHPTRFSSPTLRSGGEPRRHYVNLGVIALSHGTGILGRFSLQPVVNVSRGGGIVAILKANG